MSKRYILQKDLPDLKAGAVFEWDNESSFYIHDNGFYRNVYGFKLVENNPEWFLPEEEFGKWVPVSERMPNEDGYFIVRSYDNSITSIYKFRKSDGYWGDKNGYSVVTPIAWMPLPKPYNP